MGWEAVKMREEKENRQEIRRLRSLRGLILVVMVRRVGIGRFDIVFRPWKTNDKLALMNGVIYISGNRQGEVSTGVNLTFLVQS